MKSSILINNSTNLK